MSAKELLHHMPNLSSLPRWILLLPIALVGFVWHGSVYDFVCDDAFIALRYAGNLAEGHGLTFNPGERVEGFTSLLWVLLLSLCGNAGLDLLVCARVLGVAAGCAAMVFAFILAKRLLHPDDPPFLSMVAPLLIAANGAYACWAPAGLETAFFSFLVTAAFAMALTERDHWSAFFASAAVLCRPEGILAALAIWGMRTFQLRKFLLPWVAPVLVLLALILFRLWYFGDVLPNTYYAKTGGGLAMWLRGLRYLSDYSSDFDGSVWLLLSLTWALLSSDNRLSLVGIGCLLFTLGIIWVGGDGLPMYRFLAPVLPLYCALQAPLLARIVKAMDATWKRAIPVAIIFAALTVAYLTPPQTGLHYRLYVYQRLVEVPRWTRVGEWLKQNAKSGESIAAVPIGAVSFFSGLPSIDMLGLTDKHIARKHVPDMGKGWAGHEKHDAHYVLNRKPTYLLLGNIDVTPRPRDTGRRPFIAYSAAVFEREKDFYVGDLLYKWYEPRSVRIGDGEYLNYFHLKSGVESAPN